MDKLGYVHMLFFKVDCNCLFPGPQKNIFTSNEYELVTGYISVKYYIMADNREYTLCIVNIVPSSERNQNCPVSWQEINQKFKMP